MKCKSTSSRDLRQLLATTTTTHTDPNIFFFRLSSRERSREREKCAGYRHALRPGISHIQGPSSSAQQLSIFPSPSLSPLTDVARPSSSLPLSPLCVVVLLHEHSSTRLAGSMSNEKGRKNAANLAPKVALFPLFVDDVVPLRSIHLRSGNYDGAFGLLLHFPIAFGVSGSHSIAYRLRFQT